MDGFSSPVRVTGANSTYDRGDLTALESAVVDFLDDIRTKRGHSFDYEVASIHHVTHLDFWITRGTIQSIDMAAVTRQFPASAITTAAGRQMLQVPKVLANGLSATKTSSSSSLVKLRIQLILLAVLFLICMYLVMSEGIKRAAAALFSPTPPPPPLP